MYIILNATQRTKKKKKNGVGPGNEARVVTVLSSEEQVLTSKMMTGISVLTVIHVPMACLVVCVRAIGLSTVYHT